MVRSEMSARKGSKSRLCGLLVLIHRDAATLIE
jgi:hypothetical protein